MPSISEVRAADAHTVVMLWKERWVFGNVNGHDGVPAVPRHIFGELYAQGDKAAFEKIAAQAKTNLRV